LDVDGEEFERKEIDFFDDREHERAAAFDNTEAAGVLGAIGVSEFVLAARNDEDLVRANFGVTTGPNRKEDKDDNDDADDGDHSRAEATGHIESEKEIGGHKG
jgi:hypothetical protein